MWFQNKGPLHAGLALPCPDLDSVLPLPFFTDRGETSPFPFVPECTSPTPGNQRGVPFPRSKSLSGLSTTCEVLPKLLPLPRVPRCLCPNGRPTPLVPFVTGPTPCTTSTGFQAFAHRCPPWSRVAQRLDCGTDSLSFGGRLSGSGDKAKGLSVRA